MYTALRTEREVEVNFLKPLFHNILGYPEQELVWAKKVKVTFGRETRLKEADLVAHYKGAPVITVEAKKPTEPVSSALSQVDSYAFALQTPYSVVTNGRQFVLRGYYSFNSRINVIDELVSDLHREEWKRLKSLVSFENIASAIRERANPIAIPNSEKIQDYRRFFRKIHNEIRDRDKLDPGAAFDELSKLLFLKAAEDESRQALREKPVLTPEMVDEWEKLGKGKAQPLINQWFQAITGEAFPGVFDDHPRILLSPGTLKIVLQMLQPFNLKEGDLDVKGRAFEEFLPSQLRGKGLGQFFTPRPIVNFMVGMAEVSIHDVVYDFSCGSGGFLIKAFEKIRDGIEQLPSGTLRRIGISRESLLESAKSEQIFGVDAEPRAARTAKMNMLMWGDGRQIVRGNSLDTHDFAGKQYAIQEYLDEAPHSSGCTLILANPPFGSKEKDPTILKRYVLAGSGNQRTSERTEILFIEKGLNLLRPEGRMLIVLPQGLMSGLSNARVRDYIHSQAEIKAIASLPTHTFVQSGVPTVNTCILYLQKFTEEKRHLYEDRTHGKSPEQIRTLLRSDPEFDYPIFMGTAEYIGYEPSGRTIGNVGERTDLDLLLDDFFGRGDLSQPDLDLFSYAAENYGERSHRKKEQTIRGTARGLKTSFLIPFSETAERLDPPYYLFRSKSNDLLRSLHPLGKTLTEVRTKFRPATDAELDAEYQILSVSSDGTVTYSGVVKGEDFKQMKRVRAGDIVYNPMRINIGSIGVVPKELDGGLVSPDYVVFRSAGLRPEFLVTLLRSPFYRMYIDVITTGSIRDRLYFRDLQTIRVPKVAVKKQLATCKSAMLVSTSEYEQQSRLVADKAVLAETIHALVRGMSSKLDSATENAE